MRVIVAVALAFFIGTTAQAEPPAEPVNAVCGTIKALNMPAVAPPGVTDFNLTLFDPKYEAWDKLGQPQRFPSEPNFGVRFDWPKAKHFLTKAVDAYAAGRDCIKDPNECKKVPNVLVFWRDPENLVCSFEIVEECKQPALSKQVCPAR